MKVSIIKLAKCEPTSRVLAFLDVRLASGVIIYGISLQVIDGQLAIILPRAAKLRGRQVEHRADGRVQFTPVVGFVDRSLQADFTAGVVAALRETCPDLLPRPPQGIPVERTWASQEISGESRPGS